MLNLTFAPLWVYSMCMGYLLKLNKHLLHLNMRILASTNVTVRATMVQMPNLALIETKRITYSVSFSNKYFLSHTNITKNLNIIKKKLKQAQTTDFLMKKIMVNSQVQCCYIYICRQPTQEPWFRRPPLVPCRGSSSIYVCMCSARLKRPI